MLEIQKIRAQKDELIEGLKKRGIDAGSALNKIYQLDAEWREKKAELDELNASMNQISKEIGQLFQQGKQEEANAAKAKTQELKAKDKVVKEEVERLAEEIQQELYNIPNVPNSIVPAGNSEDDNKEVSRHGKRPTFDGEAKPHWELADHYQLIDFDMGSKVTGAGFPFYKGKGAKLQRALINFFLDQAEQAGYEEFIPPHVVNEASGIATGQLPDKEGQMYHIQEDDLYLIPTAEVPLTNMYRDVMLSESDFPVKITGYTPCFRREAGSYGKDVRGLNRLHQFDKVEIVRLEHPDRSYEALEEMKKHIQGLLEALELEYRILLLCGGDLGFTSAITYDFEVYSAAQEKWLEVSSVSNFETYQSNRLQLRFKDVDKKKHLAHTLNGSALALPRIMAALLENHQTKDGINIPEALQKYTGFSTIN